MSDENPGVAAAGQLPRGEPPRVTPREKEILCLIAEGLTDQEIARRLWVSVTTVHTHQSHLREKFQVRNRGALVHAAVRLGIISIGSERSSILRIGAEQCPGYTQVQEVEPRRSPTPSLTENTGGEASADPQGETEMLNGNSSLWYLAALLALGAPNGSAHAKPAKAVRMPGAPASSAAVDANEKATAGIVARRVWADPNVDLEVSPSPGGRYIPYVDWDSGDLALRDLATGKSRRLTDNPDVSEHAFNPAMSPDGKQVAYLWRNKDRLHELRLIGRDGSRPRILSRLHEEVIWVQPVEWSPDGKQFLALLFRKDKTSQIVWVSAADGSLRVIKTFGRGVPARMRLSPDGRTLAYDYPPQAGAPERDIFLLATDGSGEIPLVQHPADDLVAGWAPDGTQLLFASDRAGALGVWRVRIAAGRAQGAPELVKREMGAWAPLGLTRDGSLYYALRAGIVDVYTASLDPTTGQLLAPPQPVNPRLVDFNSSPAWSPDGRYLACQTKERDALRAQGNWRWASRITIRSVESGEMRELSLKHPIRIGQPSWSPDGRSLLAFGTKPDPTGDAECLVYRIDAQTGALTPIQESAGTFNYLRHALVLARDGKSLFYALRVNDGKAKPGNALLVRDLETGRDKELYRAPGRAIRSPALSPDGRQLAFATRDALMVIPAVGGEARELLRASDENTSVNISSIVWMPDGRHLLLTRGSADPRKQHEDEVWRIPVAGGEPQRVGLAMPGLRGLCVHPDGRRIAFTAGLPEIELWALEGLFPAAQSAKASAPRR
jgi:Tol biopolymer transport system component/DNA-binding CsgD family transcriptional regulator